MVCSKLEGQKEFEINKRIKNATKLYNGSKYSSIGEDMHQEIN